MFVVSVNYPTPSGAWASVK